MAAAVDYCPVAQREPKARGAAALVPTHQRRVVGRQSHGEAETHTRRSVPPGGSFEEQQAARKPAPRTPRERAQDHVENRRLAAAAKHKQRSGQAGSDQSGPQVSPSQRLAEEMNDRKTKRAATSTGYDPGSRNDERELTTELNDAASRGLAMAELTASVAEVYDTIGKFLAMFGSQSQALRFLEAGKQLRGFKSLGPAATAMSVVTAMISFSEALGRGELLKATEILCSSALTTLLSINPFTGIPVAILTAKFGSDWPTEFAKAAAAAVVPEHPPAERFLHTP